MNRPNSKEKSVLLDHPLIQSYLKQKTPKSPSSKSSEITPKTKFPLGLLIAVYEDYTGIKVNVNQQDAKKHKSNQLISFGTLFP